MKKTALLLLILWSCMAMAQERSPKKVYTDATTLTVLGKLTPSQHPWERLDPQEGMTEGERDKARHSTGLSVSFRTNSPTVGVRVVWSAPAFFGQTVGPISTQGFDLYVKKDGKWLYAGNGHPKDPSPGKPHELGLLANSGNGEKECLLYLPLYSQVASLEIVTAAGSEIAPLDPPFKGKIAVFGSSYTHGSGAGRCGMAWPSQMSRETGLNFVNLGFSGNCRLQSYFAEALLRAPDVDAYVFDGFSNPTPEEIRTRLEPFIQQFRAARPDVPLIFLHTLYREKRNFDSSVDAKERAKQEAADEMMQQMVKKYKKVYWVTTTNATAPNHETTADGSHADSYGYTLWVQSIKKPVMKILRRDCKYLFR